MNWKNWFSLRKYITLDHYGSVNVEEMYQAFKQRMIDEEINPRIDAVGSPPV